MNTNQDIIDYNLIEEECVEMVKFFNDYGLKTKYCCQGHPNQIRSIYYVMFESTVTDEDICNFINLFENKYSHSPFHGRFVKWMRKRSGEITCNWEYQLTSKSIECNWTLAKHDLKIFKSINKK